MSRKDQLIDDLQKMAADEKAGHCKESAMPDDPTRSGQDLKFIALDQDHEVQWWTKKLGCTADELREAVKAVGTSADKVREFLQRS